jgi:hypothetical protein
MRIAAWCRRHVAACAPLPQEELTRALLCFELNSHSLAGGDNTGAMEHAEAALFAVGSRLNHSCGGQVRYQHSYNNHRIFVWGVCD